MPPRFISCPCSLHLVRNHSFWKILQDQASPEDFSLHRLDIRGRWLFLKTFLIKNPIVVSYGKCHLGHFQTISFQLLTFGANWLYFQAPPICPKVKCHRKTCCFIWVNCEFGDFDFAWKTFVSFPYILNEHIKRIFDHSSSLLLTVKKISIDLRSY